LNDLNAKQILENEKSLIKADIPNHKGKGKVGEFVLTDNNVIFFLGKFKFFGLLVETYRHYAFVIPLNEISYAAKAVDVFRGQVLDLYLTKKGADRASKYLALWLKDKEKRVRLMELRMLFAEPVAEVKSKRKIGYQINNIISISNDEKLSIEQITQIITDMAKKTKSLN